VPKSIKKGEKYQSGQGYCSTGNALICKEKTETGPQIKELEKLAFCLS